MQRQLITDFAMDYAEYQGLSCKAPCSMYSTLLEHKLIEDPFYRDNELKYTDYSRKGATFTASK